nr:DUF1801 domain-containing protein [Hymenobacter norwichensis]
MNPQLAPYFAEGCGRCALVGTPACTVLKWTPVLVQLRQLVLACGLTEELKWNMPCYTFRKKNIVLLHAFKNYCALNFFKGALLQDAAGLLVRQTENVQGVRQIRFTTTAQVAAQEDLVKAYIYEALEIEKLGLTIPSAQAKELLLPAELQHKLRAFPPLQAAFAALTPGRQRGYALYFSEPKQTATRLARVEKYVQHILQGKGLHDAK